MGQRIIATKLIIIYTAMKLVFIYNSFLKAWIFNRLFKAVSPEEIVFYTPFCLISINRPASILCTWLTSLKDRGDNLIFAQLFPHTDTLVYSIPINLTNLANSILVDLAKVAKKAPCGLNINGAFFFFNQPHNPHAYQTGEPLIHPSPETDEAHSQSLSLPLNKSQTLLNQTL